MEWISWWYDLVFLFVNLDALTRRTQNGSGSHHTLRKLDLRIELMVNATRRSGGVYLCEWISLHFSTLLVTLTHFPNKLQIPINRAATGVACILMDAAPSSSMETVWLRGLSSPFETLRLSRPPWIWKMSDHIEPAFPVAAFRQTGPRNCLAFWSTSTSVTTLLV